MLLVLRRWRTFWKLSGTDRVLVAEAWAVVWLVRVALWTMRMRTVERLCSRSTPRARRQPAPAPRRVAWAVVTASRYVPQATCLTQALAARSMFSRRGVPSGLHIGVGRDDAGAFAAHAWLDCAGEVLIGKSEQHRYTRLLSIEGPPR